MPRYIFPGHYAFLRDAARQIGHPEAEAPARSLKILSALGKLCGQAGFAEPDRVSEIMAKAAELRDQLHAAHTAADLMITEVNRALCPRVEEVKVVRPARPARSGEPKS